MDQQTIAKVCEKVNKRFPETIKKKPKVKSYEGDLSLLIFNFKVKTADGKVMPRTVRVIANPKGKIIKITTSR
jgi:hypothetical protein